ncbi:MAG: tetratricopeptide repeat protein, partial [Xanthomonadales bacterium]|nr:tetratricopeptide repeat protein [Xanthomonadales bacterium]
LMLRDGNFDRAITALDQVDLQDESLDRVRYHTLRGMAHLRRNEPEPAAASLEQAIEASELRAAQAGDDPAAQQPVDPVLWVYLAQAYFQLERYPEVIATLDRSGDALAALPAVQHMRAQSYWLLEDHAQALATLDRAARLFPEDHSFLRRKVFFLVDLGLYREAAEQGRVYLERSDGQLDDYLALGNALRASRQLDEAARLLERARLEYPGDERAAKLLAHTYLDMGRINAAADLVYQASLVNPALLAEAAEIYRRAGQYQRALMLNGQVADQPAKFKQRLALLLELEQFEQAALMQDALARTNLLADEDILYALAYAQFQVGDFDASERHLQRLTRSDLFRKATELRRAMQDCREDAWRCL